MLIKYIIAILVILGLMAGWIAIQYLARAYATRHPEFGPLREDGHGCLFCFCKNKDHCTKQSLPQKQSSQTGENSPTL